MFLILLIFIPITKFGPKTENWTRIFGIFTSIMCFVIRPIFLLFGDVNFRRRVLDQGIWKALKKELFSNNAEIQPVNWFFKFKIKAHNQLYSCSCLAISLNSLNQMTLLCTYVVVVCTNHNLTFSIKKIVGVLTNWLSYWKTHWLQLMEFYSGINCNHTCLLFSMLTSCPNKG